MYDVKPEITALLKSIPGVTVTDTFPKGPADTPRITFYELGNSDPLTIANGPLSDIAIQIDVWNQRSTGPLAAAVDAAMNGIGFRRQMAADIPDPSGLKRKTMRYRGVVDTRTGRVTQ
jgi:hypothetical protein